MSCPAAFAARATAELMANRRRLCINSRLAFKPTATVVEEIGQQKQRIDVYLCRVSGRREGDEVPWTVHSTYQRGSIRVVCITDSTTVVAAALPFEGDPVLFSHFTV